ncbi:MAG: hypothetical protein A4E63_01233 [Syntrophorhabdus sp. PtaU1.Bin050]|nr:MAG: hypothetical protein A4E63_01233 [Syntrophorhabdus sp. PtaU1.Bin050]
MSIVVQFNGAGRTGSEPHRKAGHNGHAADPYSPVFRELSPFRLPSGFLGGLLYGLSQAAARDPGPCSSLFASFQTVFDPYFHRINIEFPGDHVELRFVAGEECPPVASVHATNSLVGVYAVSVVPEIGKPVSLFVHVERYGCCDRTGTAVSPAVVYYFEFFGENCTVFPDPRLDRGDHVMGLSRGDGVFLS